jgi:hypothetical protein
MAEVPVAGGVKRTRKVVVVAVVLAVTVGLGLAALLAWGVFKGFERPLAAGDLDVVVTFDRVAEKFDGLVKRPASEKTSRIRYLDGSAEVNYEYEDDALYITSTASKERTPKDAKALYTMIRLTSPTFAKYAADVEFTPRNDLYSGGDDWYSAAIVTGGTSAGHLLLVRQGKHVFMLTIGGVFLNDPAEFRALVQPRIDAMTRMR